MQSDGGNGLVEYRQSIPIYYSTMTGTSKVIAYRFQQMLQQQHFIAPVSNIGDFCPQQLLCFEGTMVMFLSTYGSGDPPQDAQEFFEWVSGLEGESILSKVSFMMFGLGNSSFKYFCGHSCKVRDQLMRLGAKELMEIAKADNKEENTNAISTFQSWNPNAMATLTNLYPLRVISKKAIKNPYRIIITPQVDLNWREEARENKNLSIQFTNLLKYHQAQVITIRQLRNNQTSNRSTLLVRIKTPTHLELIPACNISLFPLNVNHHLNSKGTLQVQPSNPAFKIPFPKMPLAQLTQIINIGQQCTSNIIKSAIMLSVANQTNLKKYRTILANNKQHQVQIGNLIEELNLGVQFYIKLGINNPRPYTLASWNHQYLDLMVSLVEGGLTSRYLKSGPSEILLKSLAGSSEFYIPNGKPILMIGNGTGMAPFRSITQYIAQLPQQNRNPLILYYGCQNIENDFYFRHEWEQYQKEGIIKLKIAQSRVSQEKQYVQHLIKRDMELVKEHLFTNEGVIFICGGNGMARQVDEAIFQCIKLHEKVPFKAYKLHNLLKDKKRIIKEVFG